MLNAHTDFQSWLIGEMERKQITNADLETASGISHQTIGIIRNHGTSITPENIEALSKALNEIPDFEYPEELRALESKVIMNGKFRVFENGVVYRKNIRGLIIEAPQHNTSRDGMYKSVSYSEDGNQKHYRVHRLVAKAFIPNPENKSEVNHIDGDGHNNHVSNLEWVTRQENVIHMYETGLSGTLKNSSLKCVKCNTNPVLRVDFCRECTIGLQTLKSNLRASQENRDRLRHIDTDLLKDMYKKVIISRFRGDTLKQIGDRWGVTNEYIRQIEKAVLDNEPKVYKNRTTKKSLVNPLVDKGFFTLKEAREMRGYWQYEMAEILKVSDATYSNYENYKLYMRVDQAIEFSKATNIPFEQINFVM